MVGKQVRLQPGDWNVYKRVVDGVANDHKQFVRLIKESTSAAVPRRINAEAARLVEKAGDLLRSSDRTGARTALSDAEHLNPAERGLWLAYSTLYALEGDADRAT